MTHRVSRPDGPPCLQPCENSANGSQSADCRSPPTRNSRPLARASHPGPRPIRPDPARGARRGAPVIAAGGAVPRAVDRKIRNVDRGGTGLGQHRYQQSGDPADHVRSDGGRTVLCGEMAEDFDRGRERHRLVMDLRLNSCSPLARSISVAVWSSFAMSIGTATPTSEATERGDQPSEPSRAASMKTVPAPLAQPEPDKQRGPH